MKKSGAAVEDTLRELAEELPRVVARWAVEGLGFDDCLDRLARAPDLVVKTDALPPGEGAEHGYRHFFAPLLRSIWAATPDPAARWTLHKAPPLPGRNELCLCGSGRKFKQCCAELFHHAEGLSIEPGFMAGLLFLELDETCRTPEALLAMPALWLAHAAALWLEERGPESLLPWLGPLFEHPERLDDDHEPTLDTFFDALLELGLETERHRVGERVIKQARSRVLVCTAHSRLATMASDAGERRRAWEHFEAARRAAPEHPQLWPLELSLLLAEGRKDEARQRLPLIAARARRAGYEDRIPLLERMVASGLENFLPDGDSEDENGNPELHALYERATEWLDPKRLAQVNPLEFAPDGNAGAQLWFGGVARRLAKPLRRWQSDFGAAAGALTALDGLSDGIDADPEGALALLEAHPDLASAIPVIDDLLLHARGIQDEEPASFARLARALADRAADAIIDACAAHPEARIEWALLDNRPLLRIVAQAIRFARDFRDDARAETLARWMIQRNPTDNHGFRAELRTQLLEQGRPQEALDLMAAYKGDFPPSEHDRSLALWLLGRAEEAEAVIRAAHEEYPAFVEALLPETLDRPEMPADGFVAFSGSEAAWYWRADLRATWVKTGALDWLAGLRLPPPRKRRKQAPGTRLKAALGRGKSPAPASAKGPTAANPPMELPPAQRETPEALWRVLRERWGPRAG